MASDLRFVIVLMLVVSSVWAMLALPRLRQRLPKIYLIARSWWLMLAALCLCYIIAKVTDNSQSSQPHTYPYQWLLIAFFILIGLRGGYEIKRLWCLRNKAVLIEKLQARGLQPKILPFSQTSSHSTQAYTRLNLLDLVFSLAFLTLIVSLIALQQLNWQREQYGVLFLCYSPVNLMILPSIYADDCLVTSCLRVVLPQPLARIKVSKALFSAVC